MFTRVRVSILLFVGMQLFLGVIGTTTQKPVSTTSKGPNTTPAPPSGNDCTDFLVDQCFHPSSDDPQVEVIHNVTMTDCQFFCDNIYTEECEFFISDSRQKICEIWKVKSSEYETACVKHEGPKTPLVTKCQNDVTNCNVSHKLNILQKRLRTMHLLSMFSF